MRLSIVCRCGFGCLLVHNSIKLDIGNMLKQINITINSPNITSDRRIEPIMQQNGLLLNVFGLVPCFVIRSVKVMIK